MAWALSAVGNATIIRPLSWYSTLIYTFVYSQLSRFHRLRPRWELTGPGT